MVYLYNREGQDASPAPARPATGATATADRHDHARRPTRRPTGAKPGAPRPSSAATPPQARGRRRRGARRRHRRPGAGEDRPRPPLKLTQIIFNDEMHGRFGTGKETDKTETRWADFFGDVQVLHAAVPDAKTTFDFDNPPSDGIFLTAQTLRVVSEPPPPADAKRPGAQLPQGLGERLRRHRRHDDPGRHDHLRLAQGPVLRLRRGRPRRAHRPAEDRRPALHDRQRHAPSGTTARPASRRSSTPRPSSSSTPRRRPAHPARQARRTQREAKPTRTPFKRPGRTTTERNSFNGR